MSFEANLTFIFHFIIIILFITIFHFIIIYCRNLKFIKLIQELF